MAERKYAELFRVYRGKGHELSRSLDARYSLFDTLEKLLEESDRGNVSAIEDFFMNNKNPKRGAQLILLDFNRYLRSRNIEEYSEVDIDSSKYYSTDIERRFALLKEMHEPVSVSAVGEKLKVGRRTISDYINDFEDGFEFMDSTIRINVLRNRRKDSCRSTAHPFFMALNSTELNHLMSYLNMSDDPSIRRVGSLLYSQLSDYAKRYICADVDGCFSSMESGYLDEFLNRDLIGYLEKCVSRREDVLLTFEYWDEEGKRHLEKGYFEKVDHSAEPAVVTMMSVDGKKISLPDDEIFFLSSWEDIYRTSFS